MEKNITELPHDTKSDLADIISHIGIRLALIEDVTGRLDKKINGNGKAGLVDNLLELTMRVKDLEGCVAIVSKQMADHVLNGEQDARDAKLRLAEEAKEAKVLLAKDAQESKDMLARDVQEAKDMLAREVQKEQDKKAVISGRTWAFIIGIAIYVVTNIIGLGFIILKSGFIK